jgi:hypothetical protein
MIATGPFDVKVTPQPAADDTAVGRMTLEKTWHGDLDATSKGVMLALSTATKGSAGYVAIEEVHGTLDGHRGSFALQHSGIMNRGEGSLTISVIPDSGTDELTGLTGTLQIDVAPGGKHAYRFEYALPAT